MRTRYGKNTQARILVVDDDKMVALTLSAILQEQGYEVATAFNGKEAIVKAATFFPDLLLSDVNMGAMNGVEAATRITAKLPDCRVLFLSGHASMSDVLDSAPRRLVFSFMSKPVHTLELLNAIAYQLSAINTSDDPAVRAVEDDAVQRYAMGLLPIKAGFILKDVESKARHSATTQVNPDVVLFDMRIPETAGIAGRLQ